MEIVEVFFSQLEQLCVSHPGWPMKKTPIQVAHSKVAAIPHGLKPAQPVDRAG